MAVVSSCRKVLGSVLERTKPFIHIINILIMKYWSTRSGMKERSMSSRYGPDRLGYTRATKTLTKGMQYSNMEQILKKCLSSNCSLKIRT